MSSYPSIPQDKLSMSGPVRGKEDLTPCSRRTPQSAHPEPRPRESKGELISPSTPRDKLRQAEHERAGPEILS
ncbi:MAG: hypothetical protein ACLFQB_10385 [Chitinispirillaceae bacterium]